MSDNVEKKNSARKDRRADLAARLFAVEAEIARRGENPRLKGYNAGPVHFKQIEFHRSPCRNRWVFGGNRSGKTECGAVETVWLARGIHPYRKNKGDISCWVVSLSQQVQRDVAQSKLLSYLNPYWIKEIVMSGGRRDNAASGTIDYITVKNVFGGTSRIGFKNCEQGREKFQGVSLDFVWFDEEPPRDIYEECRMRILDRAGHIFGTMTPLKGLTWVYDQIYLNTAGSPEIWHISMEWADNPFLAPDEIELMTKSMSADELEARRYGKFSASGGLVYPEFEQGVHVIEPFNVPLDWFDNISIDPGLSNPLSAHWYAVDYDGNIYVIAEHYEAGKDVAHHAARIKDISARLSWHKDRSGNIRALIDSAAGQRTLAANKSVCELFFDHGISVDPRVNKDVFSGIQRVKAQLRGADGRAKLFIFKSCQNLIREIKGYFWGDDDTPKKKNDHSLDELRYYIMSRPVNIAPPPAKSAITIDKDKLIRKLKK